MQHTTAAYSTTQHMCAVGSGVFWGMSGKVVLSSILLVAVHELYGTQTVSAHLDCTLVIGPEDYLLRVKQPPAQATQQGRCVVPCCCRC
jgi:hypothetical protein